MNRKQTARERISFLIFLILIQRCYECKSLYTSVKTLVFLQWMRTTLLNNRYKIIQVLGYGGFGETFLAEDIHMPSHRRCVIKQLKPVTNDPQTYRMIQQRFEREAAT